MNFTEKHNKLKLIYLEGNGSAVQPNLQQNLEGTS